MLTEPQVEGTLARASSTAVRVVVGMALVGAAILVRLPLEPILQGRNSFVVLEPAIAVAAWYGGLVSGLTATAVGAMASFILYLPASGSAAGATLSSGTRSRWSS